TNGSLAEPRPHMCARLPGEQADRLPPVPQGQNEEPRPAVLARARVPDHRPLAVIDLAFLTRCRCDDDARLDSRAATQLQHEPLDARVGSPEAVVVDQVSEGRGRTDRSEE